MKNFAGQWLLLRNLPNVLPDPDEFPNFDDNLRQAFRRETEMFFESVMREDRNVLDLLTADYTFVNERLAKHYGIPGVYGSQFRRVKLANEERRGLLGQGSILTVTSEANRTSPVKRGKFILEAILGTPPPAPPPNVPPLKENEGAQALSVRARLEEHRKNPACSGCHAVMDPLGFSLENFDGVGEWRTKEPGGAVDPSGQLADGTKVDGPVALRKAILKHPEQFVRTLTEKMMTYGARPRPGVLRHADGSRHRPRRRPQRLQVLVDRAGNRQEHAVPDAPGAGCSRDRPRTISIPNPPLGRYL